MRKVLVFKYEQRQDEKRSWCELVPDGEALFHAWGVSYEELADTGVGNYSTAIIERADGSIETPAAHMIKFVDGGVA